jgi:hypothetical protein
MGGSEKRTGTDRAWIIYVNRLQHNLPYASIVYRQKPHSVSGDTTESQSEYPRLQA